MKVLIFRLLLCHEIYHEDKQAIRHAHCEKDHVNFTPSCTKSAAEIRIRMRTVYSHTLKTCVWKPTYFKGFKHLNIDFRLVVNKNAGRMFWPCNPVNLLFLLSREGITRVWQFIIHSPYTFKSSTSIQKTKSVWESLNRNHLEKNKPVYSSVLVYGEHSWAPF